MYPKAAKNLLMPDSFFAMITNGSIKKIALAPEVESSIRNVFLRNGTALVEDKHQIEFDGGYDIESDEVLYVSMDLPEELVDVSNNPIGVKVLNMDKDSIKALFWYENGIYYFQNFDHRKMLQHKFVLFINRQTFNQLKQNAF